MTSNQVEKIERFLEGRMGPEEQKSFEENLLSDKELLAVYKTYQVLITAMDSRQKSASEKDVKTTLSTLTEEFFPGAQNKNPIDIIHEQPVSAEIIMPGASRGKHRAKIVQTWIMAAAVLGIIVIGTWYMLKGKEKEEHQPVTSAAVPYDAAGSHKPNPDTVLHGAGVPDRINHNPEKNIHPEQQNGIMQKKMFAEYFKPDARPADKKDALEDAFDLYERRHFTEAVAAFDDAEPDLSTRGEETDLPLERFYIGYYKALSYMAVGKDAEAIHLLKNLAGPDSTLQAKITWYLALSYVRSGNTQKAIPLLTELHENNRSSEYSEKANELMIKLKARR